MCRLPACIPKWNPSFHHSLFWRHNPRKIRKGVLLQICQHRDPRLFSVFYTMNLGKRSKSGAGKDMVGDF
jgi:hypothetical protein